jgi:GT2 family glycosyltransferase
MTSSVYVILVTHDSSSYLEKCLASLAAQTFQNFRLICVDNGSRDATVQDFRKLCHRFGLHHDILINNANLGFAKAVNRGMHRALRDELCRTILLFNHDARAESNLLDEGMKCLDPEDIGGCSPKILEAPDIIWWVGSKAFTKQEIMFRLNKGYSIGYHINKGKPFTRAIADKLTDNTETDYVSGCSLFLKRSAVEQAGLFDERFFMYAEDADYSLRLRSAGYRLLMFPSSTVWHDLDIVIKKKETKVFKIKKYCIYFQSMSRFIKKHYPHSVWMAWCMKQPLCLITKILE